MSKPAPITQMIRKIVEDQRVKALPDRELVRLFRAEKDQAAFQGLMRRHGNMVLDVCRNVLQNEGDAEDAFQATFLQLARKASTIRDKAAVGSWLYGVAYRTALKSRAALARRAKHERSKGQERQQYASEDLSWHDVQAVIHAELNRLSESYRAPLVLCYLEGKTQDQAALILGISKAALKKHLELARALLRVRLLRRGVGTAAMLVAVAWPGAKATACLPPALLAATLQGAMAVATGQTAAGLALVHLSALTERVVNAMFLTKLRTVIVTSLILGMLPIIGLISQRHGASITQAAAADPALPAEQAQATKPKGDSPPTDAPTADPADNDLLRGEWTMEAPPWFAKLTDKVGQVPLNAWYKAGKDLGEFRKWDRNDDGFITYDEARLGGNTGFVRLVFRRQSETGLPAGRQPEKVGDSALAIRWSPAIDTVAYFGAGGGAGGVAGPGGRGGGVVGGGGGGGVGGAAVDGAFPGARSVYTTYTIKDAKEKKVMLLKVRNQEDAEVPFKLEGDTLTLDGGVLEVGTRAGARPFFKADLKGQWKRVNMTIESKFKAAFPELNADSFPIKIELKQQGLLFAAGSATVQGNGRLRLTKCAVARYLPVKKSGDTSSPAPTGPPTTIHSRFADVGLAKQISSIADLGEVAVRNIEFADGVRMELGAMD